MDLKMLKGTWVRLKLDPARQGIFTGKMLQRGTRLLYQIKFPNRIEYIAGDQLEIIEEELSHPLDLFLKGQLSRACDLKRILTHVRLGGRLANLIYSMEISNTDFYAYQFKPVIKILNSVTNGLLIADEVGLGKTIEAGLIWTELKSRFDLRRLLVMVPAILQEKWQLELKNRFGIDAKILKAEETLKELTYTAQTGSYHDFAIITSMQGIRPRKGWENCDPENSPAASRLAKFLDELKYESELIDLLIVDEAHYMRNPESKTARIGQLLRNLSDYIILLSATPIHLKNKDLYTLARLIDEDTYYREDVFNLIIEANAPLVKARDAILTQELNSKEFWEYINSARSHFLLKNNKQLKYYTDSPPTDVQLKDNEFRNKIAEQLDSMNILGNIITRTRKRDVKEFRVIREPVPESIKMTEPEKIFFEFVTNSVREFCAKYDYHEGFLLVLPQRQMASSMPAALRWWQSKRFNTKDGLDNAIFTNLLNADDDEYEEIDYELEDYEELGPLSKELIRQSYKYGDYATLFKNDSKFNRLKQVLNKKLSENKKEKIVLFSYFRPTLNYLNERLKADGYRCLLLMGGEKINKNEIIRRFKNSDDINLLLSSEVGSEGIDLDFCRILINYDLPWNPMKVEQRIGRLDRIGQKANRILIWNLFYEDTIDGRIYNRLLKRIGIFEHTLGGLEPIVGHELRILTMDLLRDNLTAEQEQERIDQTTQAIVNRQKEEERLEEEAKHLVAYGDYILNQVKAAKEMNNWIKGKDIQNYIIDYFQLNYSGCYFKQHYDDKSVFDIQLSNAAKNDLDNYLRGKRISTTTRLVSNETRPIQCEFVNKLFIESNQNLEIINQIHPVVRFVTSQIEKQEKYHYPAVSVKLSSSKLANRLTTGNYAFSVQKWTVKGLRDIEKLYYCVLPECDQSNFLKNEDAELLVTLAASQGTDWLEAKNEINLSIFGELINQRCLALSDDKYQEFIDDLEKTNSYRADIQLKSIENHLDRQVTKLTETIKNLRQAGKESIAIMNQGKIDKLQNKMERKKMEVENGKKIVTNKEEICLGVIQLTN